MDFYHNIFNQTFDFHLNSCPFDSKIFGKVNFKYMTFKHACMCKRIRSVNTMKKKSFVRKILMSTKNKFH